MFKRLLTLCFVLLLALSTGGCNEEIANQPTGKPIGISYERVVGSVHGENHSIGLTPEEITFAECFSEESLEYVLVEHTPIASEVWDTAQRLLLAAYPHMSEITEPTRIDQLKERFQKATILDGGDDETLTVVWETENGSVTKSYGLTYTQETSQLKQLLYDLTLSTVKGEA